MAELGEYAAYVLWAYGLSLALIAGLVGVSLWQAAHARRALDKAEGRDGD
jgi:heme exporter protein D